MYRLLIVDDEPIVVEGLYQLFMEEADEELDVNKAYFGEAALDFMKHKRVDILITDISMPDINGMELQKKAVEIWPQCKVIFLTGFNDFDFILQGTRQGAIDYVVKTEKDEVLLAAVKKAKNALEEEYKNQELLKQIQLTSKTALPVFQNRYLTDLLDGMQYTQEQRLLQFMELQLKLDNNLPVLMLLGGVDIWPETLGITEKMQILHGIQEITVKNLERICHVMPVVYDQNRVVWFIQPMIAPEDENQKKQDDDWIETIVVAFEMLDSVQSYCKNLYQVSVSFILNDNPVQWESLGEIFDGLYAAFNKARGKVNGFIRSYNASEGGSGEDGRKQKNIIRMQLKKLRSLKLHLENGEQKDFFELLEGILETVKKSRSISYNILREAYYSIATIMLSYVNQMELTQQIGAKINLDFLTMLDDHPSWDAANDYLINLAKCIFEEGTMQNAVDENQLVVRVNEYVENHICEDITVYKIAEAMHFNYSYLSRLYKQITNKTLTQQIWDMKIAKAMQLLEQENHLKINEIGSMIGFESSSYFARFFKRHIELTPQEYRDLIRSRM